MGHKIIKSIASYKTIPRKDYAYTGSPFKEDAYFGSIRLGKPINKR